MWFQRGVLLVGLVFALECQSSDVLSNIPSNILEESVKLKLRTAASLRDNFLKIFNQLESTSYELNRSIQQIRKYFRNGGSFIEYLHIFPPLGYAPVERQIKGILSALDEHSPRYLLPAISVVRNAVGIENVLQPDGEPLRVDIFRGISAKDLSKLDMPTPFPKDIEQDDHHLMLSGFMGKLLALMSMGLLVQSTVMVALLLKNLMGDNNKHRRSMESVRQLTHDAGSNDEKVEDPKLDSDLQELFTNVLRIPIETAESILSHSNQVSQRMTGPPELAAFFVGDKMNYSLLLNNKRLLKTQSLLSLIESDKSFVKNALGDFPLHDYSTPDDLLTAVVSKLRCYQAETDTVSEAVENAYEDLIRKSRHAWGQPPRSARTVKSLLYGMKVDPNLPKIRRLARDVEATIETNVRPEAWPQVASSIRNANCYDPSCIVLRTLEGVGDANVTQDSALNKSISDLVRMYKQLYYDDILDSCPNFLATTAFQDFNSTQMFERILDIDDLMQAIPQLDIESEEYINLRDFLSSKDLEKQIGEDIDVEKHPTRGRLLAWLLHKVERSSNVDEEIRDTAGKLVDRIAYNGYGAAAVVFRRA